LLIVDKMLVGGIKFVLGKIAAAVEAELNDDSHMREELLAAQMRLELGEMTEQEFATFGRAFLVIALHQCMHRGHITDALRAAGRIEAAVSLSN